MNVHEIYRKLDGDWADWDEEEDGVLHIRKIELMHAIHQIEAELLTCNGMLAETVARGKELETTHWLCGHVGPGPVDERVGPSYCETCLLEMKLRLLKLSRLLSDKDLRRAYKSRILLDDRGEK